VLHVLKSSGQLKHINTIGHLEPHKRTHTGEKPYKCDWPGCNGVFSESGTLKTHKRTHTGEKNYKCDWSGCNDAFSESGHLKTHKRTHTDEKPYECPVCGTCFSQRGNLSRHLKRHEEQSTYAHACGMVDSGTQHWNSYEDGLQCTNRCQTPQKLDWHIQRNHTEEGIAKKFESERKMATLFNKHKIAYEHDWANLVKHADCKALKRYFTGKSSRPDFRLIILGVLLRAIVLVGNDEFAHRRYACDFDRTLKITSALEAVTEFAGLPVIYIRFNPHFYTVDGVFFDPDLPTRHQALLDVLAQLESGDIQLVNPTGLNLIYMYYDQVTEQGQQGAEALTVFAECDEVNKEFAACLAPCVTAIYPQP
jgi:hypothetical protein